MEIMTGALLGGLFSGILSSLLATGLFSIGEPTVAKDTGVATYGEITLATFLSSCLIMALCGILIKKLNWKWLESYALPLTIIGALCVSYVAVSSIK